MKSYTLYALIASIFLLFFCASTNAAAPGLITSISGNGITNIITQVLPMAIDMVKEMDIPDVSSGHVHISNIRIPKIGLQSFQIGTKDDARIFLTLSHLSVSVKTHFKYKNGLIKFSGDISGSATGSGTIAARLVPSGDKFVIDLTQADININDFSLHISGGLIAKILNAVKAVFQGLVKRSIKNKIATAIRDAIVNIANTFANSIPSSYAFGTAGHVISLAPAAFGTRYDHNSVSVAFSGAIDNHNDVEHHNIDQIFNPTGALFDMLVDVAVFNSGFEAIPFKVLEYNKDHPGSLPVPGWYGKDWGIIIPELALLYPNANIRIQLSLLERPLMVSQNNAVTLTAVGGYRIFADNQQIALIRAELSGGIYVQLETRSDNKQYIVARLENFGVKFVVVESITPTIIVIDILSVVLDALTKLTVGIINTELLNGLVIPSVAGLTLVNPRIDFPIGAIRFATDIKFTPPV